MQRIDIKKQIAALPDSVFAANQRVIDNEIKIFRARNQVKKTWFFLKSEKLERKFDREMASFAGKNKAFGDFYNEILRLDDEAWKTAQDKARYTGLIARRIEDPKQFYVQPKEVAGYKEEFISAAKEWVEREFQKQVELIYSGKYKQKFTEILGNFSMVKHGLPLLVTAVLGAAVSYLTYAAFQSPILAIGIVAGAIACGVAMVFDGMKQGY